MTETTEKIQSARIGVVDSDRADKTRRVVVSYLSRHPKYGKYIKKRTVVHAHDETNESKMGDRVEVMPCRPYSKTKRWKIIRVVDKSPEN